MPTTDENTRSLPRAPLFFGHHGEADCEAILQVLAVLQEGVSTSDGDLFDSVIGEDVIWGSPKGQTVLGLSRLNRIHRKLAVSSRQYGHTSRFTLEAIGFIDANVACAFRNTGFF